MLDSTKHNKVLDAVKKNGWIEITEINTIKDAMNLAMQCGKIVPHPCGKLIKKLSPKNKKNGIKNTLSWIHGYSEFPLHTDTAYWTVPVRFVLLTTYNSNSVETTILKTRKLIEKLDFQTINNMKKSIFLTKSPYGSFYSSFEFKQDSESGFRFDASCMKPYNKYSEKFFEDFISATKDDTEYETINWTPGKVLIVDNWKVMHGRKSIKKLSNRNRTLYRIYIK